jgi:hypothetical protein
VLHRLGRCPGSLGGTELEPPSMHPGVSYRKPTSGPGKYPSFLDFLVASIHLPASIKPLNQSRPESPPRAFSKGSRARDRSDPQAPPLPPPVPALAPIDCDLRLSEVCTKCPGRLQCLSFCHRFVRGPSACPTAEGNFPFPFLIPLTFFTHRLAPSLEVVNKSDTLGVLCQSAKLGCSTRQKAGHAPSCLADKRPLLDLLDFLLLVVVSRFCSSTPYPRP